MIKKLFIIAFILIPLVMAGVPFGYAEEETSSSGPSFGDVGTAPSGALDSGGFQFDLGVVTHEDIEGSVRQNWLRRGINYFFERVITAMAALIGTFAVLMMVIGGFMVLISAGNENLYNKGINYVKYSLVGLAVALGAYIIVTTVQLLIQSIWG